MGRSRGAWGLLLFSCVVYLAAVKIAPHIGSHRVKRGAVSSFCGPSSRGIPFRQKRCFGVPGRLPPGFLLGRNDSIGFSRTTARARLPRCQHLGHAPPCTPPACNSRAASSPSWTADATPGRGSAACTNITKSRFAGVAGKAQSGVKKGRPVFETPAYWPLPSVGYRPRHTIRISLALQTDS